MSKGKMRVWNKWFVCCCFMPICAILVMLALAGDWKSFIWQFLALILICENHKLHCSVHDYRKELYDEIEMNISLLQIIREDIINKGEIENGKE